MFVIREAFYGISLQHRQCKYAFTLHIIVSEIIYYDLASDSLRETVFTKNISCRLMQSTLPFWIRDEPMIRGKECFLPVKHCYILIYLHVLPSGNCQIWLCKNIHICHLENCFYYLNNIWKCCFETCVKNIIVMKTLLFNCYVLLWQSELLYK